MLHEIWKSISSLEFWLELLNSFKHLGPLAPILLTALESFIPPLPLVAIVLVNVAALRSLSGIPVQLDRYLRRMHGGLSGIQASFQRQIHEVFGQTSEGT